MPAPGQTGRIVGLLLLFQMLAAGTANFALLGPIFAPPGFLVNAAAHPAGMALAALLNIAGGATSLAIAVMAWPVFRRRSPQLALWLLSMSATALAVNAMESVGVMSLLTYSQAYANATGQFRDLFPVLRVVVTSARNWTHYIGLILGGSNLLVFYLAIFRGKLLPRALAACGIAAVLLQLTAVTMPLFGPDVIFPMLAPLGIVQLAASLWMSVRGWPAPFIDAA